MHNEGLNQITVMFIPLPTQPSLSDRLPQHKYTYEPNLINILWDSCTVNQPRLQQNSYTCLFKLQASSMLSKIRVQPISEDYNKLNVYVYSSYNCLTQLSKKASIILIIRTMTW